MKKITIQIIGVCCLVSGLAIIVAGIFLQDYSARTQLLGVYVAYFGLILAGLNLLLLMLLSGNMDWIEGIRAFLTPSTAIPSLITLLIIRTVLGRNEIKDDPTTFIISIVYIIVFFGFLSLMGCWIKSLRAEKVELNRLPDNSTKKDITLEQFHSMMDAVILTQDAKVTKDE